MKAISKEAAKTHFDRYFAKLQRKKAATSIQVLVQSDNDFQYAYSSDEWNTPFHIASLGKVFTASFIMILTEKYGISLQDPIIKHFTSSGLKGLFVVKGKNYAKDVTVEQLLAHTSGIGYYFE